MKIHEYQAKELCRKYGIAVPKGSVALNVKEASKVARGLDCLPVLLKAQIHAGGRGKGGGVKLASSLKEVEKIADEIIGMNLVTNQTGPKGQKVRKILVEQGLNIEKELYFSIMSDRTTAKYAMLASEAGGMDIEILAKNSPDKVISVNIDPLLGIKDHHCRQIVSEINIPHVAKKDFTETLSNLYKMFVDFDCSLLEINPLVLTADNRIVAIDAKIEIDSNALYRHKDVLELRDFDEEDPIEIEASKFGLNYVNLGGNGNIGSMVNGAGLAMATMDIIKNAGAEPANFLDVGGGANSRMVENGFKIILSDSSVKGILINIFGGILRCDVLAKGVIEAAKKIDLNVPVVVRMEGTNVVEGRRIFSESKLNFITASDLKEVTQYVTQMASNQ